ncbi:amidohydrolase family protein [Pseudonocardia xinjiangensis]
MTVLRCPGDHDHSSGRGTGRRRYGRRPCKLAAVAEQHAAAVALAHECGVTIAMGTDIGAGDWGRHGEELPLLVEAGLSPLQAIEAATANGPDTLGPQAPRSGQLVAGYDADVLTLDDDPLDDITVLADPEQVRGVWQAGRRVKG